MFKIFRKIRFDLLKENKTMRYIFYAVGEIILVIIGILLALNINNKNELRKQEEKVSNILYQIQKDLSGSIQNLDSAIEFYRVKDSLIYLVLNDQVTYNDYINPKLRRLWSLTTYWQELHIYDDGYKNLINIIENLPIKYESIIPHLNKLYINDKERLSNKLSKIEDITHDTVIYLMKNKLWFSGSFYSEFGEDKKAVDYFLTDSLYKNRVTYWDLMISYNFLPYALDFRADAINAYRKIGELLELNDEIDGLFIPPFSYDTNDYINHIGSYVNEKDTVEIKVDNNQLIYDLNDKEQSEIFPLSKTKFYTDISPGFYSFQIDKGGEVISFTIRRSSSIKVYHKINSN